MENINTMNFGHKRAMKVALRYPYKVSGPIHLSKRYILKIKECFKCRNDEFLTYETDESRSPLYLNVLMPTPDHRYCTIPSGLTELDQA